jgi:hypothetical protein
MKERLMAFLKANKKKIIAFVLAGVVATVGLSMDAGTQEAITSFLSGLIG